MLYSNILVRTAEKEEIEEVLDQITKENGLLKEKAQRADDLAEVIQDRVEQLQFFSLHVLWLIACFSTSPFSCLPTLFSGTYGR